MRTAYQAVGSLLLAAIFVASIVTDADARRRYRYKHRGAPPVSEGLSLQRGDVPRATASSARSSPASRHARA